MTSVVTSRSLIVGLVGIGAAVGSALTYVVVKPRPSLAPPAEIGHVAPETRMEASEVAVTLTPEAIAKANISLAPVESQRLDTTVTIPAVIEPVAYKQTVVTALVAGRVTRVTAELGQQVRSGQVLAELYSPDLAESQRAYIEAFAELQAHEPQLARTERLVSIGSVSRQELEQAHAHHTMLTTRVEGARARLGLLGQTPDELAQLSSASQITSTVNVRAPLDGVITARQANVGLNVEGISPLFTVIDLSSVWIVGDLFEPDFARVRLGGPVVVTVGAYPGLTIPSTLGYIDPQLSRETRTAKVRTEVRNAQGRLRMGMYAQMRIEAEGGDAVLVIPKTAVQTVGDHTVVYVADPKTPGRFVERLVRTSLEAGDRVAVDAGLVLGESVVSAGSFLVRSERERLNLSASPAPVEGQPSPSTNQRP